jgi:serine/threonine-protein kinase
MAEIETLILALGTRLGLSEEASREFLALLSEIRSDGGSSGNLPSRAPVQARTRTTDGSSEEGTALSGVGDTLAGFGRYKDPRRLGAGGMGEVFLVREETLNRFVALKAVLPKLASKSAGVKRFLREAQITAQLQHPGVVPVYELGQLSDGRPYFTMKEIKGRTLSQLVKSVHAASHNEQWTPDENGWTLRRLVEVFHRACETLAYAHHRNVVHRDIKPNNIMVGDFGEVLVLDWGLAKLLGGDQGNGGLSDDESIHLTESHDTRAGAVAGTPAYMAPEQARGEMDSIRPATDVHALGAVLYEILRNHPPFSLSEATTHVATDTPHVAKARPVLDFSGALPIPAELQLICARALEFEVKDRYIDAGVLAAEVSAWLEGAKNLAAAKAVLADAQQLSAEVISLRDRARSGRRRAQNLLSMVPGFAPVEAKKEGWAVEDEAAILEREADLKATAFTQMVQAALTHHADLPEAHSMLADHYADEHALAEERGNSGEAARLEVHLRGHDRGRYATYLRGDGAMTLVTDTPGAEAELFRYVLKDRRLQIEPRGFLGKTPVRSCTLPMGSYLVIIRLPGREEVRYPVQIRRLEHWDGVPPEVTEPHPIYLPKIGEIAHDECYVPPGWFWGGGEASAFGKRSVIPRRRMWLDGFVVRGHHVTISEYVTFLNALVDAGREQEAEQAAPRASGQGQQLGPLLLAQDQNGRFVIPPNNYFGIPWQGDWPIIFVDWFGASAYARWRAECTKLPYRLIWELEWEKAARGVDGRLYPWGDFFDPTWCRMLETHSALPTMAAAGTYDVDESPYQVRDMAGNQRDWCLDIPSESDPPLSASGRILGPRDSHELWNLRVARGGNFVDSPLWCWSYHRSSFLPNLRDFTVSFRTARPLGR